MGLTSIPVETFGGLNLAADPTQIGWGGAVDLADVAFDHRDRVRSRDGTVKFTGSALGGGVSQCFSYRSSTNYLVVAAGTQQVALDSGGAAAVTGGHSFISGTMFGTPSTTTAFFGCGLNTMTQFDGAAFTSPTASVDLHDGSGFVAGRTMPKVAYTGVTPWDNRLIAAYGLSSTGGPGGSASSPHHVHFSEPGDPLKWDSNNFIELTPGDGEAITGVVVWRDLVFVFKPSRFFVIYGVSTDGSGDPIFNYRAIDNRVGAADLNHAAGGQDAVYVSGRYGLYATTGGAPVLVSDALSPLFRNETPAFFNGASGLLDIGQVTIVGRRIYCLADVAKQFVLDTDTNTWTFWRIPQAGGYSTCHRFTGSESLYFAYGAGISNNVGALSPGATTDAGTTISSYYRSGYAAPGGRGREVTVREVEVLGTGSVNFAWAHDSQAVGSSTAVTLGGSLPARGYYRQAVCGESLSYKVSDVSGGAWQVNALNPLLRAPSTAGAKS